jgi:hypothetical protein
MTEVLLQSHDNTAEGQVCCGFARAVTNRRSFDDIIHGASAAGV